MLDLPKSTISFSWAMSLLGAQEVANLFASQNRREPGREAERAAYSVKQAAESQFSDLIWATFVVGDEIQDDVVDLVFDVLTLRAFSPCYIRTLASDILGQSARSFAVLTPPESGLARQELKNNYEVFNLVKHVRALLHIPPAPDFPLEELVERAYGLGEYQDLWAVEGLGHDYADALWGLAPIRDILTNERARALPDKSLTMMHAGIGLSFAQHLMQTVTPYSSESEIRKVLDQFIALCRDNARDGYIGASYESLGLVTRTWHAQMVPIVDRLLCEIDEEIAGYFWHGAGRALYFFPVYFVPGSLSPWRVAEREAPHEMGRLNAIAGLSWATTLVNIRQPEILANLLKHQGGQLSKNEGFSNGVMSSLIMGIDTTPEDVYVRAFSRYEPNASEGGAVEMWENLVGVPARTAIERYHSVLKQHDRLGEVFRYQSLSGLVAGLEGRAP